MPPSSLPEQDPDDPASDDRSFVADYLSRSARAAAEFAAEPAVSERMFAIAARITAAIGNGGKLMVAGNGGSAADAQHIAGEFISRLMYDRRPLPAIALTTDTSALTAVGNDYGFEHVFARQVEALGRPGDVLLGISTSGRSPNVLRALETARSMGLVTLGFCGEDAPLMAGCDELLRVPSAWTPVIQQLHITAAHVVVALVERALCPRTP